MSSTDRIFPEFYTQNKWTQILNRTFTAKDLGEGRYEPIPRYAFGTAGGRVLLVGCRNPEGKSSWNLGLWLSPTVFFTPNDNSNFVANVITSKEPCTMGTFNLVKVPKYFSDNQSVYGLVLTFPFWHRRMDVEIYRYDGADVSLFD